MVSPNIMLAPWLAIVAHWALVITIPISHPVVMHLIISHIQYISDTLHIIGSVFKPQFIHCTKYAKYAFPLLFSICSDPINILLYWVRGIFNSERRQQISDNIPISATVMFV